MEVQEQTKNSRPRPHLERGVRRLLKLKDAAVYLGLGASTVRRLTYLGVLPYVQEGSRYSRRVDVADLDAYVEQNKRGGELCGPGRLDVPAFKRISRFEGKA